MCVLRAEKFPHLPFSPANFSSHLWPEARLWPNPARLPLVRRGAEEECRCQCRDLTYKDKKGKLQGNCKT